MSSMNFINSSYFLPPCTDGAGRMGLGSAASSCILARPLDLGGSIGKPRPRSSQIYSAAERYSVIGYFLCAIRLSFLGGDSSVFLTGALILSSVSLILKLRFSFKLPGFMLRIASRSSSYLEMALRRRSALVSSSSGSSLYLSSDDSAFL